MPSHHAGMTARFLPSLLFSGLLLPASSTIAERISITSAGVREGAAGTTAQLEYVIARENASGPLSLPYGWLAGIPTAGIDYVEPPGGVLEFAGGELQKSLSVTVNGDNSPEPDEGVRLHVAESGTLYVDGDWRGTATVTPAGAPFPHTAALGDELAVVASTLPSGFPAPLRAWRRAGGAAGKWISTTAPVYAHAASLEPVWRLALSGRTLFTQQNESRTLATPGTIIFVHDWLPEANAWVQRSTLRMPYYDAWFLFTMTADGDTLAVNPGGTAWIYRRAAGGGTWQQEATLELPQPQPAGAGVEALLLRGDQLLLHSPVYALGGNGGHLFPWQRSGTTWTAGAPFRTLANGVTPVPAITPLYYDGAELVMVTEGQLQRRRRDTGGPGVWGLATTTPLATYDGSFSKFARDNGDVLYAGQPAWPNPFPQIFRHRGTADGGWQSAESIWTGTDLALIQVARGAMFFATSTSWEFRERTSGTGLIQDDDVLIFASSVTATEPSNIAEATAFVPITLNLRKSLPVTVAWALESVEAVAGVDFVAAQGTVTIPAGSVTAEVPVTLLQDSVFDSRETFRLVLTPVSFGLVGSPAVITVMDASMPPGLTFSSATVTEGDTGTTSATIGISLASPLPSPLSVAYRWQGVAGAQDFTSPASPFVIPSRVTSAVLPISITGDLVPEMPFERAILSVPRDAGPLPQQGWQLGEELGGTFRTYEPTLIKGMDAGDGLVAFLYDNSTIFSGGTRALRLLQRNALGGYSQVLSVSAARAGWDIIRQCGGRTVFLSVNNIVNGSDTVQIFKTEKGTSSWPVPTAFLTSVIGGRNYDAFDADADTFVAGGSPNFAEVRQRHFGGSNAWGLVADLRPSFPEHDDFGDSLAVSGDWLAISGDDTTVLLHHRHAGGGDRWGFVQALTLPPSADLGRMQMDRGLLVVQNNHSGGLLLYRHHPELPANPWQFETAVPVETGITHFSLSSDLLALNAYNSDAVDRILYRNEGGPGQWGAVQRLAIDSTAPHYFIGPVALDGLTLFVASSGTALSRFAPADAILEITDDDPQPFITMPATAAVREIATQSLAFNVTFALTNPGPQGSFTYEIVPGTARPGRDYAAPTTFTGILGQGNPTGSVGLTGLNDLMPELEETYTVRITSATGKILSGTTVVTILDDDFDLPRARPLLPAGSAMRYQVAGTAAWQAAWFQPAHDDAAWTAGLTGAGFETGPPNVPSYRPFIATDLQSAMYNFRTGALFRIPFQPLPTGTRGKYFLRMRSDDGFVAWVHGQETARSFAPAALTATSAATSQVTGTWKDSLHAIPATDIPSTGASLLAVHGLNLFAGDGDFLMLPEILFSDLPSQAWLDWMAPAFPNAAQYLPHDDMDADGLVNAAEYVLGLDPARPDLPREPLLSLSWQTDGTRLLTTLLPATLPAGARLEIEFANSLSPGAWTTGATLADGTWTGQWIPSAPAPGPGGRLYRTFTPPAGRFFRLRLVAGLD